MKKYIRDPMADPFLPPIIDEEVNDSPFKNRLRKNYRHLRKWAKRSQTDCFRIYDRDIKEYPLAIDFYAGRFLVQYFPLDKEDHTGKIAYFRTIAEEALRSLFGENVLALHFRIRIKRDKTQQYEKIAERREFFTVLEHGAKFRVNMTDYLDSGLFLDHRTTRQMVGALSNGKTLLNLFAYTCSFSIHAALAGATHTKSVDLSNTYVEWGRKNFQLNQISLANHEIIRADCLKFLREELFQGTTYDLIVIDPPTLSRSKKMEDLFDIQEDYPSLLIDAMQLLAPKGSIFFSTNSRKFQFNIDLLPGASIIDISTQTLPLDFRNPKTHRCWRIQKKPPS